MKRPACDRHRPHSALDAPWRSHAVPSTRNTPNARAAPRAACHLDALNTAARFKAMTTTTHIYHSMQARTFGTCLFLCTLLGSSAATSSDSAKTGKLSDSEQVLYEGDVIKIAYPGAANLETTQQIRRDGNINLYMVGEIKAAGRSPADLQQELKRLYSKDLISSDVIVTIVSSTFSVFVTGAVIRPGKILPVRSITVLEAIMEAGGFDRSKANLKSVTVIRTENGVTQSFMIDAKAVLSGKQPKPFYLKSHDIVYVPDRFTLF